MSNRGYAAIGLDNPKNEVNVGSVMRAAGCYDAAMVAVTGKRYNSGLTDTMRHYQNMPFIRTANLHSVIPYDCIPVAIEFIDSAISLPDYEHPERAFYVFGGEDATLGDRVLSWCRDVVYIPTNHCMNLAATVNVVLYDRMVKELARS